MLKHFVDSLTLLQFWQSGLSLIDIGSGPGFPGLPLKIADPALNLTLVEATEKKVNFLKHMTRKLKLEHVNIVHATLSPKKLILPAASFDWAVSRATFKLDLFLKIASPYLKPGGKAIAMKGPSVDSEIKACASILESIELNYKQNVEFLLPIANEKRSLIIFERKKIEI